MADRNIQKDRVLQALKDNTEGLSTFDLMRLCGTTRPANQIMDLRRDGYNIVDVWTNRKNKYNEQIRFVRYKLVGDADD